MESLEHMNNSSESKRKLNTEVQEENTKRLKNDRAPISKLEKKKNHEFRAKHKGKRNIPLHVQYARKPLFENEDIFNETDYYFENGFRKVYPYYFNFNTFCKGRWLGKTLREVYSTEFALYPIEYYELSAKEGGVKLNLKSVSSLDVKLKQNDMVSARLHRHEGPVLDTKVEIIRDDSKFLVVNKPASIPIHPCGRFRNNSLVYILAKEFGYRGLLGCHRIDRLTSGIVIFGKTKNIAQKVTKEISSREVEKEYICKVVGEFPSAENGPIECTQPVCVFSCKLGYSVAWEVEGIVSKEASTSFSRMWTDGKTSIVLCKPKTGRTHQIRIHLQYLGYPILNDPIYNHPAWGEERFKLGKCSRDLGEIVDEISKKFEDRKNLNNKFMRQGISKVKKATESCNQVEKYVNEVKKEGDGIGNVHVGEPEPELANAVKCEGITGPENKGTAGADLGFENITETDKSGGKFENLTHSNAIDCRMKPNIIESSENNHLNVLDSNSFSAQNNLDINHEKKGHLGVNEEEDLNGKSTNDNLGTVVSEDGYKCNIKPNCEGLDPLTLGLNKTGESTKEKASIETKNINKESCPSNRIMCSEISEVSNLGVASTDKNVLDPNRKNNSLYVANCAECVTPLPDPDHDSLFIYLHAWSYKGDGWAFRTKLPEWASALEENPTL